jgi:hypothetical protein
MASPLPVVKGRFVPGRNVKAIRKQLSAHLKYTEYRKLGEQETREDRHLFTQERDQIDRKDAVQDLMEHRSHIVNYHKIIFSPGEHERVDDFRQWIRDQMSDLQARKGVELHWYGVVHAHPREQIDEPHVHVVLVGAGEDLQTGDMKTVRMDRDDYAFLREQGREHSNFEFYQELERMVYDLDQQDTVGRDREPALEREAWNFDR